MAVAPGVGEDTRDSIEEADAKRREEVVATQVVTHEYVGNVADEVCRVVILLVMSAACRSVRLELREARAQGVDARGLLMESNDTAFILK